MHVTHLVLHNFRNYRHTDLPLSSGTTLLYGPNAAGKTSLLEALFYVATTRSPRTTTDRELLFWHAEGEAGVPPFARLVAEVQRSSGTVRLEVLIQTRLEASGQLSSATQKLVRINRKAARALDLIGHLRVVLFTPADLNILEGSPAARRRYLDITLSQLAPRYVRTLSHYNKLVQQRNSLLRAWRDRQRPRRGVEQELGYWDQEIASAGGYLIAERLRAVQELTTLVQPIFREISGEERSLTLRYQPSFALDSATDAESLAQMLAASLQTLRQDEIQRGQTLIGPQRDDLVFLADNINLGVYGSRGQQRSVALALKLAEAQLMQARSGDMPLLLLDDLLSELDMQRRTHLLRAIAQPHQQTILTATDMNSFDAAFLQQAQALRIEAGHIYPAPG